MALPTLKSILGKRSETTAWLQHWASTTKSDIVVEDSQHTVLFGNQSAGEQSSYPVILDGEIAGYVKGTETAAIIAPLLSLMLQKETEKKKLGTEVLNLYQELNVIYNFSEKLTETIDPDVIAQLTLEQALHSIPSHSGVIVLWDEEQRQLTIPAISGESLFNKEKLQINSGILLKIGLSGQSEIMSDLSVLKEKGIIDTDVQSVIYAAMKVKHRILGAIILAGKEVEQYSAGHLKLLVTLALQSSTAIESAMLYEKNIREVREREEAILKIHEVTKKFVPNEFIRLLGKENLTDVKLGDQAENIVTVLFTDIRDFTTLSEKMTPGENFKFVSSFNERLGPIIRLHQGFINQYLGDSIMAIFPRHPEDALNAAIAMQRAVYELNLQRQAEGLPAIRAGIGMHTGPLIMGITGDEHRLDAATISDTVNSASRIESLTKYYRSPLLFSSETLRHISNREKYHLRHLGKVQLKGKHTLLSIVECINGYPDKELQKKIITQDQFESSMNYYFEQQFEMAIRGFQAIIETDPDDRTAAFFMDNAVKYLNQGVADNWTGTEEMLMK
ncbi:MAG: GAF domain-containing protein [Chitinophagaceae bacterium]|nr:GAF domain-containing protein [Chitinophagaceae bacterium]MBK7678694.1 GAF domain-containing protein [Chitinophagaceae bacterium]MBK8299957.1 GAF domain-containing protein [Chitinophagaceae bacterium]HQW43739.1 adenylate/guanylate cyclase domain-containing protein [Chitinophagaceae bacterium]